MLRRELPLGASVPSPWQQAAVYHYCIPFQDWPQPKPRQLLRHSMPWFWGGVLSLAPSPSLWSSSEIRYLIFGIYLSLQWTLVQAHSLAHSKTSVATQSGIARLLPHTCMGSRSTLAINPSPRRWFTEPIPRGSSEKRNPGDSRIPEAHPTAFLLREFLFILSSRDEGSSVHLETWMETQRLEQGTSVQNMDSFTNQVIVDKQLGFCEHRFPYTKNREKNHPLSG